MQQDKITRSKKKLSQSFIDSFHGLLIFISERNLKIQIAIGIIVIIFTFIFPLSKFEQIIILFLIFAVIIMEMINTIIERIINHLHPHYHENIALIKNAMAAVVLIVVVIAIAIGLWIFCPYFLGYYGKLS